MSRAHINLGAERQVLSALAQNPNKIFDIDGVILRESDFSNSITQTIYIAIREIAQKQNTASPPAITSILLEEHIAANHPTIYTSQKTEFGTGIKSITETTSADDINEYLRIVVADSIKRRSKAKLGEIEKGIEQINEPTQIIEYVESEIYKFTNDAINDTDISNVANEYDTYLKQLGEEVKKSQDGTVRVGLSTGFPRFDAAIGGGLRRGTINTVAARAGYGKSLWADNVGLSLIDQGVPVLYLDTELDKQTQMNRILAIRTGISINMIETGRVLGSPEKTKLLISAKEEIQKSQFDYVSIKGWTIQEQISVIRRWLSKRVGRQEDGQFRQGVVLLDYLKLMNEDDKGNHQEYESLGYRMTVLHDLMADYGQSMLMLCQQNRSGLEREDESTVSGSDRIIWLCDNFSVLYKVPGISNPAEANAQAGQNNKYGNMAIRVCKCRHGRGTPPRVYISFYNDKEDIRIPETEVTGRFEDMGLKRQIENA